MKSLKPTEKDLENIYSETMSRFKSNYSYGYDSRHFVVKCYLDTIQGYLQRNGVEFELKWDDFNYLTKDKETE